jgi:hypothetical protein
MKNSKYIKVSDTDTLISAVSKIFNNRPLLISGDCIEWTLFKDKNGYGMMRSNGKVWRTHRFVYSKFYKKELNGLFVLHKCDNPKCVNPEHLFLGTQRDNNIDKMMKGRSKTGKTSKYRFVCYRKDTGKWRVVRTENGINKNYGQFDTEIEAWDYVQKNILTKLKQQS